jgi:transcription elongation factor GreA
MALLAGPNIMLTAEGIRELHEELQVLQERRAGLAEFLATAADDANGIQTDLALTDRRIGEIEMVLARAMPLEWDDRRPDVIGIGSSVTVRWDGDGDETYTIVEPAEAALDAGRISYESPVGQALIDRRAGDRVAVETFGGTTWLEILRVAAPGDL